MKAVSLVDELVALLVVAMAALKVEMSADSMDALLVVLRAEMRVFD